MMWFSEEALARLQYAAAVVPPQDATELRKKQAAQKAIEESGKGTCIFCHEAIAKNRILLVWESEFMLGYCNEAREHLHKPVVRYSAVEGVVNAGRDNTTDPEPIQSERDRD